MIEERKLLGETVILTPLQGEADIRREVSGVIEGMLTRVGIEYYVVRLGESLIHPHPHLEKPMHLERVLVIPDGTRLEWAFFGGGPKGLPVLVKVFAVVTREGFSSTNLELGETVLLARATASGAGAREATDRRR
jgi:hypothetical protein